MERVPALGIMRTQVQVHTAPDTGQRLAVGCVHTESYPAVGIWGGESHFLYKECWHNLMTEINLQQKGQRWGEAGHPFSGSHPSAARTDDN